MAIKVQKKRYSLGEVIEILKIAKKASDEVFKKLTPERRKKIAEGIIKKYKENKLNHVNTEKHLSSLGQSK